MRQPPPDRAREDSGGKRKISASAARCWLLLHSGQRQVRLICLLCAIRKSPAPLHNFPGTPPLAIIHAVPEFIWGNSTEYPTTRSIPRGGNMRKLAMFVAATAILSAGVLLPTKADAGCYRWGETGYHWYRYCAGPGWLYPHRRFCRHDRCWYR